ncbi:stress response protein NST1-like [Pararge aegeria]|uniref:stress response protein NST1-like n=1 Tax=Pararge aegeria TaxID=116150 RepID=UPI0019D09198|nr:stress response protein NST1-like [Pararge aegeria]
MLRFRGFKASLNFNSGKKNGVEHYDVAPGISLNGAYRTNKDELFGSDLYSEWPKIAPSSMTKLPSQSVPSNNQSKSTSDLMNPSNEAINTRKSAPDISQSATEPIKVNVKEQKKLEKKRLIDQKKREKFAEKERQREEKLLEKQRKQEEKLKKEREKQHIAQQTRAAQNRPKNVEQRKPTKRTAPLPQQQRATPQTQQQRTSTEPQQQRNTIQQRTAPQPQQQQIPQTGTTGNRTEIQQYTTNTLESSISKTSGPPPYSSVPEVTTKRIDTGNTSFAKPVEDTDSWDLISQHRQQMNRQTGVGKSAPKQTHLDLHYNVSSLKSNENSNA